MRCILAGKAYLAYGDRDMDSIRVAHYINQFFGGIGGEEEADAPLFFKEGAVGPGFAIGQELGDIGSVVGTIVCGDNYFMEHQADLNYEIIKKLREWDADILIAGPAFNAGRYGVACVEVCKSVQNELEIPTVTAMYKENPGLSLSTSEIYVVKAGLSAASMRKTIPPLVKLAVKLALKTEIGPAADEDYYPRGLRKNSFSDEPASKRVVAMLHKKLAGEEYESEVPLEQYIAVEPASAVKGMEDAVVAIVSENGLVPKGNDQRLTSAMCDHFAVYSFEEYEDFNKGEYEVVHGGYDARPVLADRNRELPLDILRELIAEGVIGSVFDKFLVTVGNSNSIENSVKIGQEMAKILKEANVTFAILPST